MEDPAARLEVIVDSANQAMNIVHRFSNDPVESSPIPSDSGDLRNLRQVIEDIESKVSVATGIYSSVAEALVDVSENELFLVRSDGADEIYQVWMKVAGVGVDTGKRALSSKAVEYYMAVAASSARVAEYAASLAETATSAIQLAKGFYTTVEEGMVETPLNGYFSVRSTDDEELLVFYQNRNGVPYREDEYPNARALKTIKSLISASASEFGISFEDLEGGIAGGFKPGGVFAAHTAELARLTVAHMSIGTASEGFARSESDSEGNEVLAILKDGSVKTHTLLAKVLNGLEFDVLTGEAKPAFIADYWGVENGGQSNAQGPTGAIHTTQAFDCLGFPAHATAPTAFLPMTAENVSWSGNQELPSFGALDYMKRLILSDLGIAHTAHSFKPVLMHTAYGGYTLAQLSKGTASWNQYVGMIQAAYNLAQAEGKTFAHMVNFWLQGEGDLPMSFGYYYSEFMRYHRERNEAAIAITGQSEPVWTVASQMNSNGANFVVPVAMATLAAADDHPNIVVACPTYFRQFLDDVHGDAASMDLEGAYLGLAAFQSIIKRRKFQPLRAIASKLQGRVQEVTFNKTGLSIATSATVPAVPQSGFYMVTPGGSEIALESIEVTQTNKVRFVWASPPPKGSRWWAGGKGIAAGLKGTYIGSCINLKDSQGDEFTYKGARLDNWCVVHTIDPRGIKQ